MRSILIFILILLNPILALAENISLKYPQKSNELDIVNGKIESAFMLNSENKSIFLLPISDENVVSNITITMPDGVIVNESNASSYGVEFLKNNDPSDYFYGGLWYITLTDNPYGNYIVKADVTGSGVYPITVLQPTSQLGYYLYAGSPSESPQINKQLPLTLFLNEGANKITNGDIQYNIIFDDQIIHQANILDNGINGDLAANDGLYHYFYIPTQTGVYTIEAFVNGQKLNGEAFSINFKKNINIGSQKVTISNSFTEELIDLNNDGYINDLVLSFDVLENMPVDGVFNVAATLKVGENYIDANQRIEASENKIYVKFPGKELRKFGYSGQFELERFLLQYNNETIKLMHNVGFTTYHDVNIWERDSLIYLGNFTEVPLHTTGDNGYDWIRIRFNVDAMEAGNYAYSFHGEDDTGKKMVTFGSSSYNLVQGVNTVELYIRAEEFLAANVDTAIHFSPLFMYPNFESEALLISESESANIGSTRFYECWDFTGCVNGANEPPVAIDDSAEMNGHEYVRIEILNNDSDPDEGDYILLESVESPANGTITINGYRNAINYYPDPDFVGTETFTYTIIDRKTGSGVSKGGSATGTVTVTVGGTNRDPIALNDSKTVPIDEGGFITVVANDSDPDGDALRVTEIVTGLPRVC